METPVNISVIIPAKGGEESCLDVTIGHISQVLDVYSISHEIIVASDEGYGRAVKSAISRAKGTWFTIMTADGSDSPADLANMYKQSWGEQLVYGERVTWHGYPKGKWLFNRLANWFIGKARKSAFKDWTNPFKLYLTHYGASVASWCEALDMSFGMELAIRANDFLIKPPLIVPISWTEGRNGRGKSNFNIKQALGYMRTLAHLTLEGILFA